MSPTSNDPEFVEFVLRRLVRECGATAGGLLVLFHQNERAEIVAAVRGDKAALAGKLEKLAQQIRDGDGIGIGGDEVGQVEAPESNRDDLSHLAPVDKAFLDDKCVGKKCPCGCGLMFSADNQLVLKPQCHMESGTDVEYWGGIITVRCRECERTILRIAVTGSDPHGVVLTA